MIVPNLDQFEVAAIDTETTGLNWWEHKVFGISISTPDGKDYYWDTRREPQIYEWLHDNRDKVLWVNQNMKFDLHMLRESGVVIDPRRSDCTMIRAALINEHLLQYSLDYLAKKYLKIRKVDDIYEELAKLFGGKPTRKAQMPNLHRAPVELVARYAKMDTRVALELWQWQEGEIERQGLREICEFERRLFPHIYDMEHRGIRVDIDEAEQAMQRLDGRINFLQTKLDDVAGFPVNMNPSGSIHKLFEPKQNEQGIWVANDGTHLASTDAGKASINAEALNKMKHPAAELIIRGRQLTKARDTFLAGHIIGHARRASDGNYYVHPNINQTKSDDDGGTMGTGSGRLSYTNPALQQIPARNKEVASVCRPCFLPDPGQKWSYGDLDQIDFRMFAHYANVPSIIQAYAADPYLDFHGKVADLTNLPRTAKDAHGLGLKSMANAKQTNLAMVFSIGNGHLADIFGLPWEWDSFEVVEGGKKKEIMFQRAGPEIEEVIDNYHEMVPGVRELTAKAKSVARSRGHVRTLMNRHIRFRQPSECRKAAGLIYQGSAADLNKELIIRFCEYFESEAPDCRMLLNIHDESSFSMTPDRKRAVGILKDLKGLAQDWPQLRVPVSIDFSDLADNWWDATEADVVTDPRSPV